jgi:ketosteroid isomerase-like protein
MFRAFVLAIAGCLALAAASSDEVMNAEKQFLSAVQKSDYAALDRLLSDNLVYTHSTGVIEDKAAYLKALKSGNQKYSSIDHLTPKVNVFDNTGVITGKVRMRGASKGVPFDNELLMIHVWVKQQGQWKLVAHQTTRLP